MPLNLSEPCIVGCCTVEQKKVSLLPCDPAYDLLAECNSVSSTSGNDGLLLYVGTHNAMLEGLLF